MFATRSRPTEDVANPLEVLTALLGGSTRAKELVVRAGPFQEVVAAEMQAYTIAVLGEVQNGAVFHLDPKQLVARNKFGVTLLHKACRYPNWCSAQYIAERAPELCSSRDDLGRVPLHDACWNEHLDFDVIEMMLRLHPEALLSADHRGHTPLCYAPRKAWPQWNAFITGRLVASIVPALRGPPTKVFTRRDNDDQSRETDEESTVRVHWGDSRSGRETPITVADRPRSYSHDDIAGEVRSTRFFSIPAAASVNDLTGDFLFPVGKRKKNTKDDDHVSSLGDSDHLWMDDDEDIDDDFSDDTSTSSEEEENWALASQIADKFHRGRELSKRRRLRDPPKHGEDDVPRVVSASDLSSEASPPERSTWRAFHVFASLQQARDTRQSHPR